MRHKIIDDNQPRYWRQVWRHTNACKQKLVFYAENKTVSILKLPASLYIYTPTIEFYDTQVNISIVITRELKFDVLFIWNYTGRVEL